MESIAFTTLLFFVYFCAACCFVYTPASSCGQITTSSDADQPIPNEEVENLTQNLWDDQLLTIAEALGSEFDPEPELEIELTDIQHQEPKLEDLLREIDLDTLQLRPARKICGQLGIQQKINGKDAPLSWLRSQIKSRFSEEPTEVVPIIQEILKAA